MATGVLGGPLWWAAKKVASAAISQDHLAIDIRIVDAQTGRIVNATSVEGTPREIDGAFVGIFENTLGGLSGSIRPRSRRRCRLA